MAENPAPKVRSIDFLTPEQLKRKREVDRKSQRQARERTRAYIAELEAKVHEYESRVLALEQFVTSCQGKTAVKSSNTSGQDWEAAALAFPSPSSHESPVAGYGAANVSTSIGVAAKDQNAEKNCCIDQAQWHSFANGLDLSIWQRIFDNTMLATTQAFPLGSWFDYPDTQPSAFSAPTHDHSNIWQCLPKHTASTCNIDTVVLDLLQFAQASTASRESNLDGSRPSFPSIQSLLNPNYNALKARISKNIVECMMSVVTTPSLPERVAFMYTIYAITRWQMNPSETTYYALPEWLRPLPCQLYHEHPPWVDLFVWPKGREKLCLDTKYHGMHPAIVRISNEAMSLNWPYRDSDMLLQVGDETILNPVFERHIRDLNNWTITDQFFFEFPDLVDCVNLKLFVD